MAYDFDISKQKFDQVIEVVGNDLKQIKTGRAKPSLVEDVMVEAYGGRMPLKELASITAPDASLIVIQPWDRSVIEPIEKALSSGQNQFNPSVDQQVIRVGIAPLTGEKREDLVKQVHQRVEGGKQLLRVERNNIKSEIEGQEGNSGVSEDDIRSELEDLDKLTQEYNQKLEEMGTEKEAELTTI